MPPPQAHLLSLSTKTKTTIRFLTTTNIRLLNAVIEKPSRCYDDNLLESAINAPVNQQHYMNQNDPVALAATLSARIIKNHAFANGNKRTALLGVCVFLGRNGSVLREGARTVSFNWVSWVSWVSCCYREEVGLGGGFVSYLFIEISLWLTDNCICALC